LGNTSLSFSPSAVISNTFTFIPVKNFNISWTSRYVGKQFIDNTSSEERKLDPWFVSNLLLDYRLKTKIFRELGFTLMINNLFSEKYESNAWVYRYQVNGQPYEMNGYFPQALINFLAGISIKI
jgi:iron complex outermembrane receptor protein